MNRIGYYFKCGNEVGRSDTIDVRLQYHVMVMKYVLYFNLLCINNWFSMSEMAIRRVVQG